MTSKIDKIAHFFHRPAFSEFQKTLIQLISLPIGAKGRFHYGKIWVNDSFIDEIPKIEASKEYRGLIWALSCFEHPEGERIRLEFSFASPIRFINNIHVDEDPNNYFISFIVQEYVSAFEKISKERLADYSRVAFDNGRIPFPGSEKGFVHVGPRLEINSKDTFSFEALYSVLKDIPSHTTPFGKEPEIKSYPLVRLEDVKAQKTNEMGLYELDVDKRYLIPYTVWQDAKYRSRSIMINDNQYVGRPIRGEIQEKIQEGQDQIKFEMEFSNIKVLIPIYIQPKKPWYKMKFSAFIALCLLSVVAAFIAFPFLASRGLSESKTALSVALIVLLLGKLFETFQSK
jgi:hypothetical protein